MYLIIVEQRLHPSRFSVGLYTRDINSSFKIHTKLMSLLYITYNVKTKTL